MRHHEHRLLLVAALLCLSSFVFSQQAVEYSLEFSTYLGGGDWEHGRDVTVDLDGNIIVVGGTASLDFPTTAGVLQRIRGTGGSDLGTAGPCDVFVAKFSPDGKLLWSTYLGGPNYDRAYGVEVDKQGFIYVTGRAGPGFPVTAGAFQTQFKGGPATAAGAYGKQNCFVTKLPPDGSRLSWSSYAGIASLCRDIAIDGQGSVYVSAGYSDSTFEAPAEWFANAYQKTRHGKNDMGIIKVSGDGREVLWATWLGGSGMDGSAASIRVDAKGHVYLGGSTESDDIPTTPGAFARRRKGMIDFYVARLSPDGSKLVYGTYLGSSQDDHLSTHNLAIDDAGNAYAVFPTGADFPTTEGVFGKTFFGGRNDWGLVKLSPTGALVRSTFIGGDRGESADGIYVDRSGIVYISGETDSTDFPTTPGAYQRANRGKRDAVFAVLSADFSRLLYGTYIGGTGTDTGRSGFLDGKGNFYLTGTTDGKDWPVLNPFQGKFAGGTGMHGRGDVILAKLARRAPVSATRR